MATLNEADIKTLKVAKYKCLQSSLFFTRYFFKHRYGRKFVVNRHHEIICDALDRVYAGKLKRLIINIGPRYGKTELAVKTFIANGLAHNPAAKFIHLTYADKLALDNSEEVKDLVNEECYQQMFPAVQLKKDSQAKNKWYTTEGGGVYAAAAAGQVTGFGAGKVDDEAEKDIADWVEDIANIQAKQKFAGAIVIDDPIKPDDASSDTLRERVNFKFDSTIRNRVNSRNTPIIVIGQRVHPEDLSGYLIENEPEEWEVISLPALMLDEDGNQEALWPFKHTVEELLKLKATNEVVFETQYQQNPEPKEGLLFQKDELHYYNPATVDAAKLAEYRVMVIDPADEGGDDLSAPIGYVIGDKVYIPDVVYNNHGTDINEQRCVDTIVRHRINHTTIEGNSAWILFGKAVRKQVQDKLPDCEIRIIKNTQNKQTRILAESSTIKMHFVFRSDYENLPDYAKFMKCLTRYLRVGKNKHDDAPDSLAEMSSYLRNNLNLW